MLRRGDSGGAARPPNSAGCGSRVLHRAQHVLGVDRDHGVVDIAVQYEDRCFAAEIAAAQLVRPIRQDAAHAFSIVLSMFSVSIAVWRMESTPSSRSSSWPESSFGDCIVTI